MRARSILLRVAVATSTIAALTLGAGLPAHAAPPELRVNDVTVTEGNAGTSFATFTIMYSGPGTPGVSVDYATADETATAGNDYTATSGTAALPSGGCKCTTVNVPILGDTTVEADETFEVNLSNPVGKTITDGQGIGTITNDDVPSASIDDPTVAENGGTMTFTVSLDVSSPTDAVMTYATAAGTATAGSDYTTTTGTLTIPSGSTTGTIDVPVLDDAVYEGDETFTMNLVAVSGVTIGDAQGLGTITEDEAQPSVTVDDPTVAENGGTMTFTISLDAAAAVDVSVDYGTSDNTATDGQDYTGQTGTATILAGATTTTVDVPVLDDSTYEGDETLNLDLTGAVNGTVVDAQGQGTITEDDPAPTISVDSPSVAEGGATLTFTISIDAAAAVDTSVDFATSDGTATDGQDYTGQSGTATITAGSTSTTVDVPVTDDSTHEGDETLSLDLSNPVNGQGTPSGTGTINDDDPAPTISVDDPSVAEDGGTLTFTISIDAVSALDTSVDYATSDGSAADGQDYTGQSGTATILAGATSTSVDVPVLDDSIYEGDETVHLDLSNPVHGQGSPNGTGTVTEDDAAPTISVDSPSVAEGGGTLSFTVSIDAAAAVDTSVDFATSDGTATDGQDYTGKSGTATITAGSTSTTVDVPVTDDSIYEGNETLTLDLSNPVNGQGTPSGTGTITDDDPLPTLSVDDPTVNEGDGTATFTVSIDAAAGVDTTVDYATSNGTAAHGQDFTATNGTATITAGSTSTTVDVPVLDDAMHESDETFSLDLSNPVNGQGIPSGTATITDDDAAPDVSIADANVLEGNSGTANLTFDVTLSNASSSDVSVDYATSDGTATAGTDYVAASGTLTIPAGSTTGTITVHAKGDTAFEPDETVTVTLSGLVGGGSITNDIATGTITNDDNHPSTLSTRVSKTHKNVGARGLLEPASTGNTVTVVLAKYRHHKWKTVKTKVVTVKKLADRDSDGLVDAQYGARFPRPKHGRYRFTVSFSGDGNTAATSKVLRFKL
jgi:hypothetical protein